MAYFWTHNCAGERSQEMLGLSSATVASWSQRFRVCVMNWEERHSEHDPFGGKRLVESDECEVGRKRKGLHGRDSQVKGDFRGLYERHTGRLLVEAYQKLRKEDDERRFGPPSADDVRPLVERLLPGTLLFTDGARAYTCVCKELGIFNSQVDHNKGEFTRRETIQGKVRVVSSQGIDGAWGNMKNFLRARGGCSSDNLESSVKEFQWRWNLPDHSDPFLSLLECI